MAITKKDGRMEGETMPYQDSLFETADLPMADLFEAADYGTSIRAALTEGWTRKAARQALEVRQCVGEDEATMGQVAAPAAPATPQAVKHCLQCGKSTAGGMFCNATHRAAWTSSMNGWNARLARTSIEGEQELF